MNCRDIELIVIKLAGNHLLEATARARAVAHIEACARCAARLAEERALWAGMRAVVAEIAQEEAPAHVKAALLEAFREQAAAQVEPTIIQSPARTRRWPQWMIAAAVAIVVLVLVASIFWRRSGSPNRRPEAQASILKLSTTAVVRPSPAQVNTTISEKPAPAQRQIARHPRRQRRHSAPSDLSETEVATDFFPLVDGDDLASLESGRVVRVELPGSALAAVGLPIDAALANKPVKADVVLGADGVARLIRFVRQVIASDQ